MILDDPLSRFGNPWPQAPRMSGQRQTTGQRRYPPRQCPADPTLRRPGWVYGILILDPVTREIRMDYVGKTRNPKRREAEHREDQPFGDLIVGGLVIIEQGLWNDLELDDRETFHIHRALPRYNWQKNERNPHQIPKWVAREQRWARDRAAGRPLWVPPEERVAVPVGTGLGTLSGRVSWWAWLTRPRRRRRSWPRPLVRAVQFAVLWLALAGSVWWLHPASVPAGTGARDGAVAATLVCVLVPWLKPRRRRRRRRR